MNLEIFDYKNSQSAAYTFALADANKTVIHPAADVTARTFTINSNANAALPIGTRINVRNETGAGVITITITTDTLEFATTGAVGNRTLTAPAFCILEKLQTQRWQCIPILGVT